MREAEWMTEDHLSFMRDIKSTVDGKSPKKVFDLVNDLNAKDKQWRETECINLVPSECLMSETTRKAYGSNQMFRVDDGPPGDKDLLSEGGDKFLEKIEGVLIETTSRLFGADFVEHRPLCGNLGCVVVYMATMEPGDHLMSIPPANGGNPANLPRGFAGSYGLGVSTIPMEEDHIDNVDLDQFKKKVKEDQPDVVTLGSMIQLTPYRLQEICDIAHAEGAVVFYDAAHLGAFMAARQMEDPLREGVDVLLVNIHKMYGGPMGAFLLTNDSELAGEIDKVTYLGAVQTPHASKIVSSAIATAEMMEYAEPYSKQIVDNAQTLAEALVEEGVPVMEEDRGFTESHLFIVDARPFGGGKKVERALTEANIVSNKMPLPTDYNIVETEDRPIYGIDKVSGYRVGTPLLTRQGMKEEEMKQVARFMSRVLVDEEPPKKVGEDVKEFMKDFQKVHYSFDETTH